MCIPCIHICTGRAHIRRLAHSDPRCSHLALDLARGHFGLRTCIRCIRIRALRSHLTLALAFPHTEHTHRQSNIRTCISQPRTRTQSHTIVFALALALASVRTLTRTHIRADIHVHTTAHGVRYTHTLPGMHAYRVLEATRPLTTQRAHVARRTYTCAAVAGSGALPANQLTWTTPASMNMPLKELHTDIDILGRMIIGQHRFASRHGISNQLVQFKRLLTVAHFLWRGLPTQSAEKLLTLQAVLVLSSTHLALG